MLVLFPKINRRITEIAAEMSTAMRIAVMTETGEEKGTNTDMDMGMDMGTDTSANANEIEEAIVLVRLVATGVLNE